MNVQLLVLLQQNWMNDQVDIYGNGMRDEIIEYKITSNTGTNMHINQVAVPFFGCHFAWVTCCKLLNIKWLVKIFHIHVSSLLFIGSFRSAFSLYRNQLCPLKVLSIYARSIVLHASKKRRFSSVRAPEQWL